MRIGVPNAERCQVSAGDKAPEPEAQFHKVIVNETRIYQQTIIVKAETMEAAVKAARCGEEYALLDEKLLFTTAHAFGGYVEPMVETHPGVFKRLEDYQAQDKLETHELDSDPTE
jgi:hypothetical protein